jgi:hypothetical protein
MSEYFMAVLASLAVAMWIAIALFVAMMAIGAP